ncbi:hypothetical protein [Streptomyces tsukubensis]|uniref:ABC transporter permease n=1 Tax=Streptomyces tsukubensis TaxID=83656 RepID=A0A1V4A7J2_9ACTN|nr:hypothetical protein [Streptomyces tsukubensis]OON77608.1 hypothetical protein B1H18_17865 [Streptomyces tsukubensis]QFR93109.1 hypothetical protein GBW32_08495 [Streptomyces tsukubensis]
MSAPLTPPQPPHDQSSHDPWRKAGGQEGATAADQDPGTRAEIRQAVLICVALVVCGALFGLLWCWLAPRVPLVSNSADVYLKDSEGEQAIGGDGTFILLGLAFGVVSAVVVFLLRRRGGIPLVVGLALGGLLGSLLAWRVGIWLGPTQDVVAHAKEAGQGVTFDAPLELSAKGALLAWPVAAMAVLLGLTALFGPREPDPYAEGFAPYPGE